VPTNERVVFALPVPTASVSFTASWSAVNKAMLNVSLSPWVAATSPLRVMASAPLAELFAADCKVSRPATTSELRVIVYEKFISSVPAFMSS